MCFVLASFSLAQAKESSKPNIIFVFADDWGYGDLGVHGHLTNVKTPHLDELSQQGVLFTDAHITAPQCSPSRAELVIRGRMAPCSHLPSITAAQFDRTQ